MIDFPVRPIQHSCFLVLCDVNVYGQDRRNVDLCALVEETRAVALLHFLRVSIPVGIAGRTQESFSVRLQSHVPRTHLLLTPKPTLSVCAWQLKCNIINSYMCLNCSESQESLTPSSWGTDWWYGCCSGQVGLKSRDGCSGWGADDLYALLYSNVCNMQCCCNFVPRYASPKTTWCVNDVSSPQRAVSCMYASTIFICTSSLFLNLSTYIFLYSMTSLLVELRGYW